MSLVFDAPMRHIDPIVAGVNHLPLVTSLRIGDDDGFERCRGRSTTSATWRDNRFGWTHPPAVALAQDRPARGWTKADILANNRVKLEIFRRFGVLPGSSDTHVAEFFPWFVTQASDFGRDWGIHHYGLSGHRADKAEDDGMSSQLEKGGEVSEWPSGELVAPLLDAVVSGKSVRCP